MVFETFAYARPADLGRILWSQSSKLSLAMFTPTHFFRVLLLLLAGFAYVPEMLAQADVFSELIAYNTVQENLSERADLQKPTTTTASLAGDSEGVRLSIVAMPSNKVAQGGRVTFFAQSTLEANAYLYQWYRNGSPIVGATSSSFTAVAGADFVHGDIFSCVMSNLSLATSLPFVRSNVLDMAVLASPQSVTLSLMSSCSSLSGEYHYIHNYGKKDYFEKSNSNCKIYWNGYMWILSQNDAYFFTNSAPFSMLPPATGWEPTENACDAASIATLSFNP